MESAARKKLETSAECYEIWISRGGIGTRLGATVMQLNFPGSLTPSGEVTNFRIAILDGHFDRLPPAPVKREWKDLPEQEQRRYNRQAANSPVTGAELFNADADECYHLAKKSFPKRFFEALATYPLGVSDGDDIEALRNLKHAVENYSGSMPLLRPYIGGTPKKG